MSRFWAVVKREYLENVRTKAFLIGVVITPVWLAVVFFLPRMLEQTERTQRVVIVDETETLGTALARRLEGAGRLGFEVELRSAEGFWTPDAEGRTPEARLLAEAGTGAFIAVVLTEALLEKRPPAEDEHPPRIAGARGLGTVRAGEQVEAALDRVLNDHLIERHAIDATVGEKLRGPVVEFVPIDESGKAASPSQVLTPLIFMLFLFMGIMGISQLLINSTLEEKSNRVYEVLLSSISPLELMGGKIIGACGVGFTLLALWAGGGFLAAIAGGFGNLLDLAQIGWFLAFYVFGFLMIASLMVAIGSACNTIKEAQNLMAPISILLALPLVLSLVVMDDPNGTVARVLSFVPPFTPFVMMARIAGVPAPPAWESWAALAVLVVATWVTFRLAARVFRVGILLYGQPPSLRQLWRWMTA